MNARSRIVRAAASLVIAGSIAVGASGCVFITPIATLEKYDPADGVQGTAGVVELRNVVGVLGEDGKAINLLVTLYNTSDRGTTVTLQFDSAGKKTTVEKYVGARSSASFGGTPDGEQIVVLFPDVPAGDLLPVYAQQGDAPGTQLLVPVLDAQGIYAELAPPAIER